LQRFKNNFKRLESTQGNYSRRIWGGKKLGKQKIKIEGKMKLGMKIGLEKIESEIENIEMKQISHVNAGKDLRGNWENSRYVGVMKDSQGDITIAP
jgi:hypothetical protein